MIKAIITALVLLFVGVLAVTIFNNIFADPCIVGNNTQEGYGTREVTEDYRLCAGVDSDFKMDQDLKYICSPTRSRCKLR